MDHRLAAATTIFVLLVVPTLGLPQSHQQLHQDMYDKGAMPHFLSRGQNIHAIIGETLVLPCEIQNIGSYVVLWRRGANVLTAGAMTVIPDMRFRLVDGYNLEIRSVMPQDAGDYVCQIATSENKDQIHTVEILVPPTISSQSSINVTARKGSTVTLKCEASGNPVPTITWNKKGALLPSGEEYEKGFSLTLEQVDRHQAGVYQCTASNGVRQPVNFDVTVNVLYPPEVEVERSWVNSGEGYEAQLVCEVHAEPLAEVMWFQDSFELYPSERRNIEIKGNKHILSIRGVVSTDFGNYSCVAENSMGRSKKYMELSGRPSPARFLSAPFSRGQDSYNLSWVVQSWLPLDEVRLLWRRVQMNDTVPSPGRWHDMILASGPNAAASSSSRGGRAGSSNAATNSEHAGSYLIRPLQPGAMYEALVKAKNRHGWNEESDYYKFYTRSAIDPVIEENDIMGDAGPHASTTGTSNARPHRTSALMLLITGFSVARSLLH